MKSISGFRLIVCLCLLLIGVVFVSGRLAPPSTSTTTAAIQFEKRCGWVSNPTPGNAWLDDRAGQWISGTQGGHQAQGDWPDFKPSQWVRTNGNYGYGCACMQVKVNRETREVLEIKSAYARSLQACRRDRSLKEPK